MSSWKDVVGYEGQYMVSDTGQVKSLDKIVPSKNGTRKVQGKIMALSSLPKGYKRVQLKGRGYSVHRLVAFAFIERINGKDFVNHKNGIPSDNRVENLEWCTVSENTKHAYALGRISPPCSRLEDVHYLTYATCKKKFKASDLIDIMSFANFRLAATGKSLRGSMAFLNDYAIKNKKALKKISEGDSIWDKKTTEQIQESLDRSEGV